MRIRKRAFIYSCGFSLLVALAATVWICNDVERKVRSLLRELRATPKGSMDFLYSGRSDEEIQADFDRLGRRAVPALIDALNDPDGSIRYLAVGQLGRLRDARAVQPLIHCLQADRDEIVRHWAADALGEIGDASAVRPLVDSLADQDSGLRFCAAKALGNIGDKRAFEPLLVLLTDKDLYPRAYATEALGRLGDTRAFEPLLKVLKSDDDSWVRSMAATGLGHLQDARAIPALLTACHDESSKVAEAAEAALAQISH